LDTSYLRALGSFGDPDFRKLLEHSKAKRLQILVPHIVWEERRTQLLEERLKMVQELRNAHERLLRKMAGDPLLDGLEEPALAVWSEEVVDDHSKKVMQQFAIANGIEVVRIGSDHAERAWQRFFAIAPPFDPVMKREDRRKDIPDSWILETAIDLKGQHKNLCAFCCDEALTSALRFYEIETYYCPPDKARETTRDFLGLLEAELAPPGEPTKGASGDSAAAISPSSWPRSSKRRS
jgi:PIN domain